MRMPHPKYFQSKDISPRKSARVYILGAARKSKCTHSFRYEALRKSVSRCANYLLTTLVDFFGVANWRDSGVTAPSVVAVGVVFHLRVG